MMDVFCCHLRRKVGIFLVFGGCNPGFRSNQLGTCQWRQSLNGECSAVGFRNPDQPLLKGSGIRE